MLQLEHAVYMIPHHAPYARIEYLTEKFIRLQLKWNAIRSHAFLMFAQYYIRHALRFVRPEDNELFNGSLFASDQFRVAVLDACPETLLEVLEAACSPDPACRDAQKANFQPFRDVSLAGLSRSDRVRALLSIKHPKEAKVSVDDVLDLIRDVANAPAV